VAQPRQPAPQPSAPRAPQQPKTWPHILFAILSILKGPRI
jgi:hypothetical protein